MPEILGIIPARANSQRVPGKNLRMLHGKPLVHYAMEAALNSKLLSTIVLSSDSLQILEHAEKFSDSITTIERPPQYSTNSSPAIDYVRHALSYIQNEQKKEFDIVAIIQASSPLTRGNDIDNTIQLLFDHDAECAVSIREVPYDLHPLKQLTFEENTLHSFLNEMQSQNLISNQQQFYVRNGSVYVSSIKLIRSGQLLSDSCVGYLMPADRSVDINEEIDLLFAEFLMQRQRG